MFDFGNHNFAIKGLSGALPELYTDGFDEEQVIKQLNMIKVFLLTVFVYALLELDLATDGALQ